MTCRVFSYSSDNKYANDYYFACRKFDNIQGKVKNYEHRTEDRESPEYQKLLQEFKFWDAEVPKTSNIAGAEEEKLRTKNEQKDVSRRGETLDFLG